MIFGTDTSRYQALGTYDPGAFEIVNVEEPDSGGGDFTATILLDHAVGRPWGIYVWVHPGQYVRVTQAVARVRALGIGDPPLGYWLDYEEAGVTQGQIDTALADADGIGVRMGVYTYLYLLPGVDVRGRDLWLAYYPGRNDGTYPAGQDGAARAAGAVLWQFTSGANSPTGGLDQNVVIDEAWYAALVGSAIPDAPMKGRDAMWIAHTETGAYLVEAGRRTGAGDITALVAAGCPVYPAPDAWWAPGGWLAVPVPLDKIDLAVDAAPITNAKKAALKGAIRTAVA